MTEIHVGDIISAKKSIPADQMTGSSSVWGLISVFAVRDVVIF